MIFKFDKGGNMEDVGDIENIKLEGVNIDMARKKHVDKVKERFIQMDSGVIDQVKEEIFGMMDTAIAETAVGFESVEEVVDDNMDEDMVQHSLDDENGLMEINGENKEELKGDNNMKVVNGNSGLSNEELEEMERMKVIAMEKMRNLDLVKSDNGDDGNSKDNQEDKGVNNVSNVVNMSSNMSMMPSLSNKTRMEGEKELILNNVYPVYRNGKIKKWMTTLNCEQISNLYENTKQIYYDFETQRGFKTTNKGEMKPLLISRHIDDILKKMASSEIAGGALTFCYFKENEEEIEYDEDDHTILFRNKLAIIDGAHRVFSSIKMTRLNKRDNTKPDPTLFEYPIFLEFLSKQEAMALFSEYASSGKRIGRVRVEALNVLDISHDIVEEIIKKSELHNKVERVSSSPKDNNIILFSTIMNGVRIFKPKTKKDEIDVSNFLSIFWSELIYLFKDEMGNMDFKERKEIRKQTFLLEPMFLMGLFHVAKTLMDLNLSDEEWIAKLKKLKEDANFFSRENKIWLPIMREGKATINTSKTQKIVIDEMVKKVLS